MSFWAIGSSKRRPIRRLTAKIVFVGLVTAWRFAGMPTSVSPPLAKATIEGVVRIPSAFSMTFGVPPSMTATQEFVVPRSMPMTLAAISCLRRCGLLIRFVLRGEFVSGFGPHGCSCLALPGGRHPRAAGAGPGAGTSPADRDALHPALRLRAPGHGDGEHPVAEGGRHLVRVDIRAKLQGALEPAVPALAVHGVAALALLLAAEGQDAVVQRDLEVLLLEARQLGDDLHLLLGLADLHVRPGRRPAERGCCGAGAAEEAEEAVEHPVHLALQREEGVCVDVPARGRGCPCAAPRD